MVSYRNQNTTALLTGTTPQYISVRNFTLATGRFLNAIDLDRNKRVAILGSQIAERLFGAQSPIGQQVRIKNVSFEIVGVMAAKGSLFGTNYDEAVFIPLTVMANQIVGQIGRAHV